MKQGDMVVRQIAFKTKTRKSVSRRPMKQSSRRTQTRKTLQSAYDVAYNAARNNMLARRAANPRPRVPRGSGIAMTNVPVQTAYTVQQNTQRKNTVLAAREYIGAFTVDTNTQIGAFIKFPMSPASLGVITRIGRMATMFQKYRFRRLALTIQSSAATNTGGLYVVGYNSNPDADFQQINSVPTIFDFDGAKSAAFWITTTSVARIQDASKWYNLDLDSKEIMQTIQGYFALAVQSRPAITGPLSMPVILDYEVEFCGASLNSASVPVATFPAGSFGYNVITGNYTFTVDPSETVPVPTLVSGTPYLVNPVWPVDTVAGPSSDIGVIVPTALSWLFYRTVEDFQVGAQLLIQTTFSVLRTTLEIVPN